MELRVPVALQDLGGEDCGLEPEALADDLLDLRIEVRVRAHCAAQFPDADARLHLLEALQRAGELIIHERELEPESDGLRVDAVAAANHRRHGVFPRTAGDDDAEVAEVLQDDVAGFRSLHGERGIEHVAARHTLVHPAASGADIAGDVLQKGDDIVVRAALDFLDLGEDKLALLANGPRVFGGDVAQLRLRLASERLDLQPNLVFALVSPNGGHLRQCVSCDHSFEKGRGPCAVAHYSASGTWH